MASAKEELRIFEDAESDSQAPVRLSTPSRAKAAAFGTPRRGLGLVTNASRSLTTPHDTQQLKPKFRVPKFNNDAKPHKEELPDWKDYPPIECFPLSLSPMTITPPCATTDEVVELHDASSKEETLLHSLKEDDEIEDWDEYPPVEFSSCTHEHDRHYVEPPLWEEGVQLIETRSFDDEEPQLELWTPQKFSELELANIFAHGIHLDRFSLELLSQVVDL